MLPPGGTSTDNPDGGIYTHGYHFLSDAAENTFDDFFVAAPHNYGPEVINQGLAYYLAAWIHAFLRFEPMYAFRWKPTIDKHLARREKIEVIIMAVFPAPLLR